MAAQVFSGSPVEHMRRLKAVSTRFTFHETFHKSFKRQQLLNKQLLEKSLKNTTPEREDGFNIFYLNYLTVIHVELSKDLQRASELNGKALNLDSCNFNALWNKANICLPQNGDSFDDTLKQLCSAARINRVMLIAKAEIAGMYQLLGPAYNRNSIQLYEKVLDDLNFHSRLRGDAKLYNYSLRWRVNLAHMYSRFMVRGMSENYSDSPPDLIAKIDDLLTYVINADDLRDCSDNDQWDVKNNKNWALTELANAKIKYSKLTPSLPRARMNEEIESLFKRAMEIIAPEKKSYTLESYGKFRLYQARCVDDYMFSINLYKEAIEQNDDNYMAMHETGCAYRKLWGFVENHRQTEYGEISGINDGQRISIPAVNLLDTVRIPAPYKCVPSYEFFKCHNPVSRETDNPHLLKSLSYSCFKKANEKANRTNSLILVELARTCVSLGHVEEALSYFAEAENAVFAARTMAYMFEQRALLVEKLACDDEWARIASLFGVDRILKYYRESIRFGAQCKVAPNVGFYNLLKLLYHQTQLVESRHDDVLKLEYFLIFTVIQDAHRTNEFLTEMTRGPEKTSAMWNLIQMLFERNNAGDASTALTYITILATAGRLRDQTNLSRLNTRLKKQWAVFEISKRAVEEGNVFPENIISKTYDWLVELSKSYKKSNEKSVCLVANSVANSNVGKVSEILTYCTIPFIEIFIEDLESPSVEDLRSPNVEDLRSLSMEDPSRNPEMIRNVTQCASAILVVYDETLEQHHSLRDALEANFLKPTCLVIPEAEQPRPNLFSLDLPTWGMIPNEQLEKRDVILNNGYPLLGALVFGLSPD